MLKLDVEVEKRIASASNTSEHLQLERFLFFDESHLSIATKRCVYEACVLSVLLDGSECWVSLKK